MTETTNDRQATADIATDLDDVEAHGLREVAAAATIGAAVVGAGGVALAAAHTPAPKTPAIVQQASEDARDIVGDSSDAGYELAGAVGSDVGRFAKDASASAHQVIDPRVQGISGGVHSVGVTATGVAKDTSRLAAQTASAATTKATYVTANSVDQATGEVRTVTQTSLRILGATRSVVDQGWDLSLQAFGSEVATGGDALNPTGRVTVTNATGNVLASAKLGDGIAKLHIKAVGKNEKLTIRYDGDAQYNAVQLAWRPPVGF